MSMNEAQHKKSKHIDLRHHFIRDMVSEGLVRIKYIPTSEMIADIFTKSLVPENSSFAERGLGSAETNVMRIGGYQSSAHVTGRDGF